MYRELRVVSSERVMGWVADGGRFGGAAAEMFSRRMPGKTPTEVTATLMAEGWSNGYVYLAPAVEGTPPGQ